MGLFGQWWKGDRSCPTIFICAWHCTDCVFLIVTDINFSAVHFECLLALHKPDVWNFVLVYAWPLWVCSCIFLLAVKLPLCSLFYAYCPLFDFHSLTNLFAAFYQFFFNSIFAGSCGIFTLLVFCQACQLYFSILATSVHKARNDRSVSSSTTIKVWAKEKYSRSAEMLCSSRFILCYKDICKVIQDYVF